MDREFFSRKANIVAKELLGCVLVRKIKDKEYRARIVETEAYFGPEDPASRACQDGDLKQTMEMDAGTVLVYGVHNNWLVNFVTGEKGKAEAVLIRAVEPLNFKGRGNGPGLLTKALDIDKSFHKKNVFSSDVYVIKGEANGEIVDSFRIGVKEDLSKKMRFYIK